MIFSRPFPVGKTTESEQSVDSWNRHESSMAESEHSEDSGTRQESSMAESER